MVKDEKFIFLSSIDLERLVEYINDWMDKGYTQQGASFLKSYRLEKLSISTAWF